jgi:transposase
MYAAGYSRQAPGWKPPLTYEQEVECYHWAPTHNPDKYEYGDGLGYDFREVVFTDETPARIGEERGMQRACYKEGEKYSDDVKKDRNRTNCCLQFYGSFRYKYKGPCYTYMEETEQEKRAAEQVLMKENQERQHTHNLHQTRARSALQQIGESDVNKRYYTRKKQYVPSQHDYKRGERTRGGVDGYRHREGALKKLTPWINSLKEKGIRCILLQDGAPAHKSRISRDYIREQGIETMWWPGHSPEVNASEHAWPWIRRHVTSEFTPSCNATQCRKQWEQQWDAIPIETINRWVMGVPEMVRRIIKHGGKNDFHG